MEQEYQSLMANKSWALTTIPPGRNAIKSKWVFKARQKEDGTIERFKAQLVAQGFSQRYGICYDKTLLPYRPRLRYVSWLGKNLKIG